jgi:hypothetical protein
VRIAEVRLTNASCTVPHRHVAVASSSLDHLNISALTFLRKRELWGLN